MKYKKHETFIAIKKFIYCTSFRNAVRNASRCLPHGEMEYCRFVVKAQTSTRAAYARGLVCNHRCAGKLIASGAFGCMNYRGWQKQTREIIIFRFRATVSRKQSDPHAISSQRALQRKFERGKFVIPALSPEL